MNRLFIRYVYVTTWSTVDDMRVTSIIHCRHVVTFLFHDCDKLRVRSVAAKRIGVGKMLYTICSEYEQQLSSWSCWRRLLFIVRLLLSIVKIWSAVCFFYRAACNAEAVSRWEFCPCFKRVHCDKTEERSVQILYHTKDHLA